MLITLLAAAQAAAPEAAPFVSGEAWTFFGILAGIIGTHFATRYTEKNKRMQAVETEKLKQEATQKAEKDKHEATLKAEKERLMAVIEADKAKLIAEKEIMLAGLEAEKESLEAQLEIETTKLATSRDSSTQEEIKRIRDHFWKTVADLQAQILELKSELRAYREYTEALREYIYTGKTGAAPKLQDFDRTQVRIRDVMDEASVTMKDMDTQTGPVRTI